MLSHTWQHYENPQATLYNRALFNFQLTHSRRDTEDVEELDDELVAEVDVELDEELEPACQRHVNTKRRNLSTFTMQLSTFRRQLQNTHKCRLPLNHQQGFYFQWYLLKFSPLSISFHSGQSAWYTIRHMHVQSVVLLESVCKENLFCISKSQYLLFPPDQWCQLQGKSIWYSPHHTTCLLPRSCHRLCGRRRRSSLPQTWALSLRYKCSAMFLFLPKFIHIPKWPSQKSTSKMDPVVLHPYTI